MSENNKIILQDENGQDKEFEIVEVIEVEEKKYVLVAAVGDEDDAYVYRVDQVDGKEQLVAVLDDEEFEIVLEEYNSYFDEE